VAVGDLITDYCQSIPGYERLAQEPAFNLALYYHAEDRHALFVRNGVIFHMVAHLDADEARSSFEDVRHLLSTRPGHPSPVLDYYQRVYPVEHEARKAALQKHGPALHEALTRIRNASKDQFGTLVAIRPKRVADAISAALTPLAEATEDARDAVRAVKAVMPPHSQEVRP